MEKSDYKWLEELSIDPQRFSDLPEGQNPLLWGLRNDIVDEEAYVFWASTHYILPAIKPEFFSMAVDFSLIEKFSQVFQWNESCFPIYMWEDTLFVACLEPPQIESDQKICFVIGPFSAMEMAWTKHNGTPQTEFEAPQEQVVADLQPLPVEVPNQEKPAPQPTKTIDLGDLDFSKLGDGQTTADSSTPEMTKSELAHESTEAETDFQKNERTEMGALPTATETIHIQNGDTAMPDLPIPDMEFDQISVGEFSLEGELTNVEDKKEDLPPPPPTKNTAPPNVREKTVINPTLDEQPLPTLSGLKAQSKTPTTVEEPALETNSQIHAKSDTNSEISKIDDDYTPLPFETNNQTPDLPPPPTADMKLVTQEVDMNTVTDIGAPVHIPPSNKISDLDLKANASLSHAKDRKGVVAHILHHLTRDFKKLMWVELGTEDQFFPKYIYGPWAMRQQAWDTHVNLTHPNIFRIASISSLPFHGEIFMNPFNEKYFELWNNGQKPNFATVYPLCYDDTTYGFVVGFDKGEEFESISTLKKIENLASIVKSDFLKAKSQAA